MPIPVSSLQYGSYQIPYMVTEKLIIQQNCYISLPVIEI